MKHLEPEAEADRLLAWHDDALPPCLAAINQQFQVVQTRTQFILTLATLTLTITGFSGPTIAQTNALARYSIAIGIIFVLASVVLVLIGTLTINWITMIAEPDDRATLITAIRYRNTKTQRYRWELLLLVIGLSCYVCSVVTFLLVGIG